MRSVRNNVLCTLRRVLRRSRQLDGWTGYARRSFASSKKPTAAISLRKNPGASASSRTRAYLWSARVVDGEDSGSAVLTMEWGVEDGKMQTSTRTFQSKDAKQGRSAHEQAAQRAFNKAKSKV